MQKKLLFRIKSKIEKVSPIQTEILNEAESLGYNADMLFCIRLALDEALINAIIHGNQNQEHKLVHVTVHLNDERISVTIRDEGNGFDQNKLVDPREEPYLHQTSGRGVFLIRQFTHDVQYNEIGNEITFTVCRIPPLSLSKSG